MSNGETTNLGPQIESSGPRFSVIDMGSMVGPERMNTMGMLRAELRSVYEDNSVVQTINRAVADPGDALILILKPLMVLVAVVVGFIGAALIMESRASANPSEPVAAIQPAIPEPEPIVAAAVNEVTEEQFAQEEVIEEATEPEPEPEPAVAAEETQPARKIRKPNKRAKKRMKHKKRKRRGKRRRR